MMGWALIYSLGAMNDFFVKFQRIVYCENGQTLGTNNRATVDALWWVRNEQNKRQEHGGCLTDALHFQSSRVIYNLETEDEKPRKG